MDADVSGLAGFLKSRGMAWIVLFSDFTPAGPVDREILKLAAGEPAAEFGSAKRVAIYRIP